MRNFLTVDIGGTLIKYGVITEEGNFIERFEMLTEAHLGRAEIVKKVKQLGREMMAQQDLSGVCISTAGQVDSKEGKILYASSLIPDYTGTPLKQELEAYFDLPVEVENDVNCAGLAESWMGTGKDVKSLFCLTVGTGIGGSYILDNKLHTGHSFSGGEIGYIPIEGRQFQELASTRVLVSNVARLKEIPESDINGKKIFELAHQGDEVCIHEIERLVYYLSKGIATIAYMMNPEMIIIGGGISAQKEYLYPLIIEQLQKDLIASILSNTKIEIARNLNDAGMIGALRHFLLQESLQPLNQITTMLGSNRHKLTKGEQMIADYISLNLESVPNKTISELAQLINVSEATITRFCKKLNIGSYNRLRLMAKEAIVSARLHEKKEKNDLNEIRKIYTNMFNKFETLYRTKDIVQLKDSLISAKQIFLYSPEELEFVTKQLKYKLMKTGIAVDAFTNRYQMDLSHNLLKSGTVVIGLSLSGYDSEVISILEVAKSKGAQTISITSQQDSPVSNVSDFATLIPTMEQSERENSSISEISMLYFIDILSKELKGNDGYAKKVKNG
ncbi:ROK family protein [Sporosarcina globispora]|uniref:ROK family protein n=1 Tax=Sporosarcina globispora TaxID=1459 RepID=UPI000840D54B|nr:ROK family protein [Sporosarcina globispora]